MSNHDRHGQHMYGSMHKRIHRRWAPKGEGGDRAWAIWTTGVGGIPSTDMRVIARLAGAGWQVVVVVATDGEGSHPDSPTLGPEALAARRRGEADDAITRLGTGISMHHL